LDIDSWIFRPQSFKINYSQKFFFTTLLSITTKIITQIIRQLSIIFLKIKIIIKDHIKRFVECIFKLSIYFKITFIKA